MTEKEFFQYILQDFYEPKKIKLDDLSDLIASIGPAFGEVVMEVQEKEQKSGKSITFIDKHIAKPVLFAGQEAKEELSEFLDKEINMSTVLLIVHLDEEDVISVVEHGGLHLFTPANKSKILFYASLVGKKVI